MYSPSGSQLRRGRSYSAQQSRADSGDTIFNSSYLLLGSACRSALGLLLWIGTGLARRQLAAKQRLQLLHERRIAQRTARILSPIAP